MRAIGTRSEESPSGEAPAEGGEVEHRFVQIGPTGFCPTVAKYALAFKLERCEQLARDQRSPPQVKPLRKVAKWNTDLFRSDLQAFAPLWRNMPWPLSWNDASNWHAIRGVPLR